MPSAKGRFALPENTLRPRKVLTPSMGRGFSTILCDAMRASAFSSVLTAISGLVHLAGAGDGQRVVGNVLGHGRAGGHLRAAADLHRRDQVHVGADEGLRADDGLVL